MKLLLRHAGSENLLLLALGMLALLSFFASVAVMALLIREKRYRGLGLSFFMALLAYALTQCITMYRWNNCHSDWGGEIIRIFETLPDWLIISLSVGLALGNGLFFRNIHRYDKKHVTRMSIKEAMDNLPSGILCYAPGARTLLTNRVMEDICRRAVGEGPINGEDFAKGLRDGRLAAGCKREVFGSETMLILPDGRSWKISEGRLMYENRPVEMLLTHEMTELYQKTIKLGEIEKNLTAQEKRLSELNHSIVGLTTEQEILKAKVKIHDEMGSNLLAIKRYITEGGTQEEKEALMAGLHRNLAFLKSEAKTAPRDEYELILNTAKQLGVTIHIRGRLPQDESYKHILAVAIHECCTNTLRHARGDEVYISIEDEAGSLKASFRNNGLPPEGEIRETGGLASLRSLTEQAGGRVAIRSMPDFMLEITLPKEIRE